MTSKISKYTKKYFYYIIFIIILIGSFSFFYFGEGKISAFISGPCSTFLAFLTYFIEQKQITEERNAYHHQLHLGMHSLLNEVIKYQNDMHLAIERMGAIESYIPDYFQKKSFLNTDNLDNRKFLTNDQITNLHIISELIDKNNKYYHFKQSLKKRDGSAKLTDKLGSKEHKDNIEKLINQIQNMINSLLKSTQKSISTLP